MSAKTPFEIETSIWKSVVHGTALLLATSCGMFVQDSVTFHGTQCSDSWVWLGGDVIVAGGLVASVGSAGGETAAALIPASALLLSAAAGYYKRGNCIAHRQNASPEEFQRDADRSRRQDEARNRAMQEALRNQVRSQGLPSPGPSTSRKKYKNNVRFECNGSVLIDETFHSFEQCDQFRRNNKFECSGMRVPINC